jgi:hypothetical protein
MLYQYPLHNLQDFRFADVLLQPPLLVMASVLIPARRMLAQFPPPIIAEKDGWRLYKSTHSRSSSTQFDRCPLRRAFH